MTSDESLLETAGRGDGAAFETLVGRYSGELFGFFRRRVGEDAAADLLQDCFLRAFRAAPRFEPRASARTWLYVIARNAALNHLARRRKQASLDDSGVREPVAAHPSPEEAASAAELAGRVRAAVEKLPEALREVVILRHYQQLPFRELARVLEIPEGTATRRMSDALERLRGELGD